MNIKQTQGITLQSIAYKEKQRIISIFTKDQGIISLIIKGISEKKTSLIPLTAPFCVAEILYRQGKSDIFHLQEASIIDENLDLRKDLTFINTAYHLAKAILDSQLPLKKSSSLYLLLTTYLKKIPFISSQDGLVASFLLKLLKYEGLINLSEKCNLCNNLTTWIHKGECLCDNHTTDHSHLFSKEEIKILQKLLIVKSFSQLETINCQIKLKEKIVNLFKDLL